jgi:ABC-2 type transport system permease protein
MNPTYIRFELLRTLRNRRFFIFSLVFPLVLYILTVGPQREQTNYLGTGLPVALYSMVGMVAWGTMAAVIAGGARIAIERSIGWVRQLRLTPLRVPTYFGAKVLCGYVVALVSIALLYTTGILFGVRLPLHSWLQMTLLILVGLAPFAAMGVWLGHVITPDTMGPVMGGLTAMLALIGGAWGPITGDSGILHTVAMDIPSYWLVQAAQSAITGEWWPVRGWLVVGLWTLILVLLARRAYVRDTMRV